MNSFSYYLLYCLGIPFPFYFYLRLYFCHHALHFYQRRLSIMVCRMKSESYFIFKHTVVPGKFIENTVCLPLIWMPQTATTENNAQGISKEN